MTGIGGRTGLAKGDVLLILAGLAIVGALAYPWVRESVERRRVDHVAQEVEALRAAALRYRDLKGEWPPDAEAGTLPVELQPFVPADLRVDDPAHPLDWDVWESVTIPEAPEMTNEPPPTDVVPRADTIRPPTPVFTRQAGVTVHSGDPTLLGLLLQRFGEDHSFVRATSWTLLLALPDSAG